ncbi:MAG TPA: plastocyanin/azurin family copper-binding protein [Longimicrobiaceae bacterium]|nr:plastocyanin/azurin family copper-binding protein [Longimicrobiaceae bacterium]
MKVSILSGVVLAFIGLHVAACGAEPAAVSDASDEAVVAEKTSPTATQEPATAPVTGEIIEVKMVTEGADNYFEPANVTAEPGDVVRFTMVSGVHNVSFPAAENPGADELPAASPYLQMAGQTYDVVVDMEPGVYNFQCDPHAIMGMKGTLTVQE